MDIQKTLHAQNKLCAGCSACHDSCPVHAIHMEEDPLGFLYPVVDEKLCTDCRRCEHVCPKLNAYHGNSEMPDCYAARAEDKIRMESSSGGIFTVLARHVLSQGGIVCGAAMDETYTVRHICVENEEGLARLRQSKYVQSDMRYIYREMKRYLDDRKTVLFSGCPCQVAGVRNYFGNDAGILYVDLLCHGVPSNKMLRDYIRESFQADKISGLSFRSKLNGWRSEQLRVFFKDGTSECIPWEASAYEEGFQRNIILRDGCEDCEFCGKQRQGDITLGDFWRVEEYDPTLNDGKGTSVVLVNNQRGEDLLHQVAKELYDIRKTPIEAARYNRFQEKFAPHPLKERFKILYTGGRHNFGESVFQCRHSLYDIGLIGYYTVGNYGGELTQYALYRTLTDLGYSVLMIAQPEDSSVPPDAKGARLFEKDPYAGWDKSRYFANTAEMKNLNLQCRVFVTGSDQMFNNTLYRELKHYMVQDFVKDNHCKIAYAASFGHDRIWGSESDRASEAHFLKKFDYISTREDSGVEVFRREFGVEAVQVLDPVFLCPDRWYEAFIARCAGDVPKKPYLFAYVLDPDRDKEAILRSYAAKSNLVIKALTDHIYFYKPEQLKNAWNIDTCTYLSMESWMAHIAKSKFVITDSFHGMCVAIINHRQFIVIVNKMRGETRFVSILRLLGLEHRMVYSASELEEKLNNLGSIDYQQVDNLLTAEKHKSLQWLCNAIEEGKNRKKPFSTFDLADARIDELWKRTDQRIDHLTGLIPQEETFRKLEDDIRKLSERIETLERLMGDDSRKAVE